MPNSMFPPEDQNDLLEQVKNRIGLSRYVDYLKVIRETQEKLQTPDERKARLAYSKYVNALSNVFTKEEKAMTNNGKNIKQALEKTDLTSEFLTNHLKTFLDDAQGDGAYHNSAMLNTTERPPTYSGMTKQDSEELNRDYILTSTARSCVKTGGKGKEMLTNDKIDQDLQFAENLLLDKQVRLARCLKLQSRVQHIVQNGKSVKAGSSKQKLDESWEFTAVEVAELAQMLKTTARSTEQEIKSAARGVLELLRHDPDLKGPPLVRQIASHRENLSKEEEAARMTYRKIMENSFYNSIMRNSATIKFLQNPSVTFDSLMNEILDLEAGRNPSSSSFSGRDDDVGRNLTYDDGLVMQFETTRWHPEVLSLIFKTRYSVQLQPKIEQFQSVLLSFLDLTLSDNKTSRSHAGDFSGVILYGDELFYSSIRLYHALITRVHSAFLLAEVAVADTNFRNHTNEVGKPRREGSQWDGYLSDSDAAAGGWTPKPLPSIQGNAYEKMDAFLKAINRKALCDRKDPYSTKHFEMDVLAAVGPQGNQLFTVPRILNRLRDTFRDMNFEQLDDFESYLEEVKNGNCNATANYEREVSEKEHGWLFKFQCVYSDSYRDDDFGSVGEIGDIGRVKVTIKKRVVAPENKNLKRPTAADGGTRSRKRRKKNGW